MDSSIWHPLGFLARFFNLNFQESGATIPEEFRPERMEWDSLFFNAGIFKLPPFESGYLKPAEIQEFFAVREPKYVFTEVPSEATAQIRALAKAGFSLVETRLHYYHLLENLPVQEKSIRLARPTDVEALKRTASGAVNSFDRYHADPFFSKEDASRYLETYISNCVGGFAECVFVPDLRSEPASFTAITRMKDPVWQETQPLYRIPLTACLPSNKGWHFHLCLAALHHAKNNNAACLVMTTQATNRAVIHNCEKLGFKLGSSSHIFSQSNQ